MTINDLKAGQSARIVSVGGKGGLRRHFFDIGLIPEAELRFVKRAPMGDPVEITLNGYSLSLRSDEAGKIEVEVIEALSERKVSPEDADFGYNLTLHEHNAHPGYGEGGKYHNGSDETPLPRGTVLRLAVVGQHNSGKTTLFNQLTGESAHVGNFPGVTVEMASAPVKGHPDAVLYDLPGMYSLDPYTDVEKITLDFLRNEKPHAIINIVDAGNIERNLYLSLQLMQLGIPMVIALNMMDEFRSSGASIRINEMERELGLPIVPITASGNDGVQELLEHALHVAKYQETPAENGFTGAEKARGDEEDYEQKARRRYEFIRDLCDRLVHRSGESREQVRSRRIDSVVTGKWTAVPSFILVMGLVFWLTFDVLGLGLQNLLSAGIGSLSVAVQAAFARWEVAPAVSSLVTDALFGGVGTVLSFVPIILVLFFFLSILEDSGYMSRVAFVSDKLLRKIGLSGRSIVPMLIGFGCSVPAVMATRTLPSSRDRRLTIQMVPFMSCSAKIAVYGFLTSAFFPGKAGLIIAGLYFLGIVLGILYALGRRILKGREKVTPFVMELPVYRLPKARNVGHLLWDKTKDFLQMAFTVILLASIVIWFLRSFNLRMEFVGAQDSMLAAIAGWIAPVMAPLGLGDWRIVTALITGFLAKEGIVATIEVLGAASVFTAATAVPMLVFCLLYTPCIATVTSMRRELGLPRTLGIVVFQCALAWVCAWAAYLIVV